MNALHQHLSALCARVLSLHHHATAVGGYRELCAVGTGGLKEALHARQSSCLMATDAAGHLPHRPLERAAYDYRVFFEGSSEPWLITDRGGRIVDANRAASELLHVEIEQLRGAGFSAFVVAPGRQDPLLLWPDAGTREVQATLRTSQGPVPVLIRAFHGADGEAIYWTVRDLRPERDRHKWFSIFESATGGILVSDAASDEIEMVNPAYAEMQGYGAEELIGRQVLQLVAPDCRSIWLEHLMQVAARGCSRCDCQHVRKDGTRLPVCTKSTLVKDSAGVPLYRVDYVRDLSHEGGSDAAMALRARELENRAEELARSNADLENFAGFVAHDLRAPLMTLSSCVELLAERAGDKLEAPVGELMRTAQQIIGNMSELIASMLDYSRVGSDLRVGRCDCEEVLNGVLADLRATVDQAGALVTRESLPQLQADERQIARLFQNLIENAIKYRSEAPPRIHISAREEPDLWLFSVSDNGIGIAPEHLDTVFELFKRLEPHPAGAGIGLAISKRIVEQHGGRIWVASQPGQGTTVHFTIPRPPGADR